MIFTDRLHVIWNRKERERERQVLRLVGCGLFIVSLIDIYVCALWKQIDWKDCRWSGIGSFWLEHSATIMSQQRERARQNGWFGDGKLESLINLQYVASVWKSSKQKLSSNGGRNDGRKSFPSPPPSRLVARQPDPYWEHLFDGKGHNYTTQTDKKDTKTKRGATFVCG